MQHTDNQKDNASVGTAENDTCFLNRDDLKKRNVTAVLGSSCSKPTVLFWSTVSLLGLMATAIFFSSKKSEGAVNEVEGNKENTESSEEIQTTEDSINENIINEIETEGEKNNKNKISIKKNKDDKKNQKLFIHSFKKNPDSTQTLEKTNNKEKDDVSDFIPKEISFSNFNKDLSLCKSNLSSELSVFTELNNIITNNVEPEKVINQPIYYEKGETATEDLIPTCKKRIGKGESGEVYQSKKFKDKVVKKSGSSLLSEYEIGIRLDHPNLMKVDKLYIKKDGFSEKHKLLLEKITGVKAVSIYEGEVKENSITQTIQMLDEAKGCCLYLFKQNIIWGDLNPGNIFFTKRSPSFKIIDFGYWKKENDSDKKTFCLLLGAIEFCYWLIKTTKLPNKNKDSKLEEKIIFTESYFADDSAKPNTIYSQFYFDNPHKWHKKLILEIKTTKNDKEKEQLLANYFNNVSAQLKQLKEN